MRKTIFFIAIAFLLTACSNKKETPKELDAPVYAHSNSGASIRVPILIDDLVIGDIHYYPLYGIKNYYGVQARITNKTEHIIEFVSLGFRGTYKNEEYRLSFMAEEETICQNGCKRPKLSFYGEMYFPYSIELIPDFMKIQSVYYRIKDNNLYSFEYNFNTKEYRAI